MVLDTHALVWLDAGSDQLGVYARKRIDQSLQESALFVSAMSFWEVAMLVDKGRLTMAISVETWRRQLLDSGLQEIPLTGDIAITSANLPDFHGDPADRIITATAILRDACLCTADKKILLWEQSFLRLDAGK